MFDINIEDLKKELKSKTVSELKNVAKGFGLEINDKIKKSELVDLIANEHYIDNLYEQDEEERPINDEIIEQINQDQQGVEEPESSQVVKINIDLIDDSPMNFFHPLREKKYNEVKDSIDTLGLLTPIIVRPKENGRYEILAGHNRKNICKDLGWTDIIAIIKDVDDDEAQEIMADTNIAQRDDITPIEIAKAYAIKQKALGRRQGKRTDLDNDIKGKTEDIIGKEYEVSGMTVQRYLRLNNLIPEIQDVVENGKLSVNTAFELGMVDSDTQRSLLEVVNFDDKADAKKVSAKNVKKIRKTLNETKEPLSSREINNIFNKETDSNKDTVVKFVIPADYDDKVKEFIAFKMNEEPMFLLSLIRDYINNN